MGSAKNQQSLLHTGEHHLQGGAGDSQEAEGRSGRLPLQEVSHEEECGRADPARGSGPQEEEQDARCRRRRR